MSDGEDTPPENETGPPAYGGPERRWGIDRRLSQDLPQPPPGQGERRRSPRRKEDRIALEGSTRIDASGHGGRLYRRVDLEVMAICRPLHSVSTTDIPPRRARTLDFSPGGLAMLLEEQFPVGTPLEVLVRFGENRLAAEVQVLSVTPQGGQFLHNCRFTRLGTEEQGWLTEYLRRRDTPPT